VTYTRAHLLPRQVLFFIQQAENMALPKVETRRSAKPLCARVGGSHRTHVAEELGRVGDEVVWADPRNGAILVNDILVPQVEFEVDESFAEQEIAKPQAEWALKHT
jgi:hypothetical protein